MFSPIPISAPQIAFEFSDHQPNTTAASAEPRKTAAPADDSREPVHLIVNSEHLILHAIRQHLNQCSSRPD